MTQERDIAVYLDDIVDAAMKARQFTDGVSFEEFEEDERTSFAVIRALEILGEATKKIPSNIRDLAPDLPWQEMSGMRDKLIHAYQGVDLKVVWRTVQEDLPAVIESVRKIRTHVTGSK